MIPSLLRKFCVNRLLAVLAMSIVASPLAIGQNADAAIDRRTDSAAKTIGPSDVFSQVELANRKAAAILIHLKMKRSDVPSIRLRETGLKPMHIYQLHLLCLDQLRQYERSMQWVATPLILASPVKYRPADVFQLSQILSDRIDKIGDKMAIAAMPNRRIFVEGKNPTDVYTQIIPLLAKLMALNATIKVTPSEVFSQMMRIRKDAQAILTTVAMKQPAAERRRLKVRTFGMGADGNHLTFRTSEPQTPADSFQACMDIRRSINRIWAAHQIKQLPLPSVGENESIGPSDVYLQTQIIIAELNLLKLMTATTAPTSPTDEHHDKTAMDVFQEAVWTHYMLEALEKQSVESLTAAQAEISGPRHLGKKTMYSKSAETPQQASVTGLDQRR